MEGFKLVIVCTKCGHVNEHGELIDGTQCVECKEDLSKELF